MPRGYIPESALGGAGKAVQLALDFWPATQRHGCLMTAEAYGEFQSVFSPEPSAHQGGTIQIALGVWVGQVDGGGDKTIPEGQNRNGQFHAARCIH